MDYLVHHYRISERRACKLVEQHRSTQRYAAMGADESVSVAVRTVETRDGVSGHGDHDTTYDPFGEVRPRHAEGPARTLHSVPDVGAAGGSPEGVAEDEGDEVVELFGWQRGETARQAAADTDREPPPETDADDGFALVMGPQGRREERAEPEDAEALGDAGLDEDELEDWVGIGSHGADEHEVVEEPGEGFAASGAPAEDDGSDGSDVTAETHEDDGVDEDEDEDEEFDWVYDDDSDFVGHRRGEVRPARGTPRAGADVSGAREPAPDSAAPRPRVTNAARDGERPLRAGAPVGCRATRLPMEAVRFPAQMVGGATRLAVDTGAACVAGAYSVASSVVRSLCPLRNRHR